MSVKPTTRLGYHFGVRRQEIPNEGDRRGSTGESKFKRGTVRSRMAGDIDINTAESENLRPPIKGLWLKSPSLRLSKPLSRPPGGRPIPDETDFF